MPHVVDAVPKIVLVQVPEQRHFDDRVVRLHLGEAYPLLVLGDSEELDVPCLLGN